MDRKTERKIWAGAKTLTDLGDLTADWLKGAMTAHPGYRALYVAWVVLGGLA